MKSTTLNVARVITAATGALQWQSDSAIIDVGYSVPVEGIVKSNARINEVVGLSYGPTVRWGKDGMVLEVDSCTGWLVDNSKQRYMLWR